MEFNMERKVWIEDMAKKPKPTTALINVINMKK